MADTPKLLTSADHRVWLAQVSREAMPRFYFHIRCHGVSKDELGLDFPDVVSAHNAALRADQNLEVVFVARGRNPHDCTIKVENASGELVLSLAFAAIFNGQAKAGENP